jgi:hypothetical protein
MLSNGAGGNAPEPIGIGGRPGSEPEPIGMPSKGAGGKEPEPMGIGGRPIGMLSKGVGMGPLMLPNGPDPMFGGNPGIDPPDPGGGGKTDGPLS